MTDILGSHIDIFAACPVECRLLPDCHNVFASMLNMVNADKWLSSIRIV